MCQQGIHSSVIATKFGNTEYHDAVPVERCHITPHSLLTESVGDAECDKEIGHTYPVNTTVWVSLAPVFRSTPRVCVEAGRPLFQSRAFLTTSSTSPHAPRRGRASFAAPRAAAWQRLAAQGGALLRGARTRRAPFQWGEAHPHCRVNWVSI